MQGILTLDRQGRRTAVLDGMPEGTTLLGVMTDCTAILRFTDHKIAVVLFPWLVPVEESAFDLVEKLGERLESDPESIFVSVAVRSRDSVPQAVLIAYLCDDVSSVLIWQAQSKPGFKWGNQMFGYAAAER